ncbi:hypothetical protein FB45DRAFT_1032458 [Roridomyces roridus]|uniref:C2H2-type domain-containing protein n=1 Tax=Roridomyces roridus TaxID=1738132 RepID=A0AAD7BHU9_9AGAR|nr:hypothetical protein FB45DRAFT_1032458 [Roridomyces roridus]
MILSYPVEALLSSQLDITLGAHGRLSCRLKPNAHKRDFLGPADCQGVNINLESVPSENGYILSFYASPDAPSTACPPNTQEFARPAVMDAEQDSPLSHPLSGSSPPPDYFSAYNNTLSPLLLQHGELEHHPLDFDFSSNGMDDRNYNTHHFSGLMDMAPGAYGTVHSTPSSDGSAAGSSRRPSPFPSTAGAVSPPCGTITPSQSMGSPDPAKTGRRAARQYPCLEPACDKMLTSPYTRQVHMGTHKAKVRKTFLCTLGCGEAFTRQHDRQRHEVALHGKKCKHVCARCKRFFSSAKMLDRHACRHRQQPVEVTEEG